MTRILVVYHSQTGHTRQMAEAVYEGAKVIDGVEVNFKKAVDATIDDLLTCDGLAIGTPENFGYMSGMIMIFLTDTWRRQTKFSASPMSFSSAPAMTDREPQGYRAHRPGLQI